MRIEHATAWCDLGVDALSQTQVSKYSPGLVDRAFQNALDGLDGFGVQSELGRKPTEVDESFTNGVLLLGRQTKSIANLGGIIFS